MIHQTETEELQISIAEGREKLKLYIAKPAASGHFPLVIVGMEIFGLNSHIQGICNDLAARGFIVAAPDYYSRIAPDTALGYSPDEREKGLTYMRQLNREDVLRQTSAVVDYLLSLPFNSGSLGFVGFSVGGHIGFYCATKLPFKLVVCYYAGWLTNTDILLSQPQPTMTQSAGITKHGGHVIFIKGEHDQLITRVEDAKLEKALADADVKHELFIYPDTGHGFFCEERPVTFNRQSRDESWNLVISALSEKL